MDRSAVAYLIRDKLILAPIIHTSTGLGLEVEPVSLNFAAPNSEIAAVLGELLRSSDRVVTHPSQDEWKGFFKAFLDAAGVRSYKAFMRDASRVNVQEEEGHLKLIPQRNLGSQGGFEDVPEAAIMLEVSNLEDAANTLTTLLAARRQP